MNETARANANQKMVEMRLLRRTSAAALVLGLALSACHRDRGERYNLLLVTFDTTRADRIGCYGNDRIRTPNVDALAGEGVLFANAYSAVPITAPSHSTILTGKYPMGHGVRDNGLFVLGETQQTLAEMLRDQGYVTAAAVGAYPLTARFGLGQGFDLYDDHVTGQFEDLSGQRVLPRTRLFFDERRAARVNEAVYPWLEEHRDRPFFLWVHYFDPHQPFEPPPPYDELYANDLYNGEIAYADEALGSLRRRLERLGVWERTIVVFTADHGEGLGEHDELTHSIQTYNTTLHVPLIVRLPGGRSGEVVETRVGTVDITPTALDLLSVAAPARLHGRSLAAAVRAGAGPPLAPRALYAESLAPRLAYHWGELRVLFDGDLKYIFGPRPELYDLAADPRELRDLAESGSEVAARLERRLAELLAEHAEEGLAGQVDVDPVTRRRLMALGYVARSGGEDETIEEVLRRDGVAPQDRVGDASDFSEIKHLLFRQRPMAARELVSGLLQRDPRNPVYLEMLATAEMQMGRFDAARSALNEMVRWEEEGPITARLRLQLASFHVQEGAWDAALALVRQSLEREPSPFGYYLEANVLQALGREREMLAALETALQLEPAYVPARVDLAIHQARQGKRELAEGSFRRALADEPYFARAQYNYGAFLVEEDALARAAQRFVRAVELDPRYWQAYYALLAVRVAEGRMDEARELYGVLAARASERPETAQARQLLEGAG